MKGALTLAPSSNLYLVKCLICGAEEWESKKKAAEHIISNSSLNICKYIDSHTREYSQFTVM